MWTVCGLHRSATGEGKDKDSPGKHLRANGGGAGTGPGSVEESDPGLGHLDRGKGSGWSPVKLRAIG